MARFPACCSRFHRLGLVFLLLTSLLAGCGLLRPKKEGLIQRRSSYLVRQMENQQQDFEWIELRTRIKYQSADQKGSAKAYIRMRKDSAIWISAVPLLGIEVIRVMITPDSMTILNRLKKEWQTISLGGSMQKQMALVGLQFADLQRLFIGDIPAPLLDYRYQSAIDQRQYVLRREEPKARIEVRLLPELFEPTMISYQNRQDRGAVSFRYEDYQEIQGRRFPSDMLMELQFPMRAGLERTILAQLNITRIEPGDQVLAMPFSIPSSYEAVE